MTLANVALTDTFDTWRGRTNQLVVINNNLTEGSHFTTGTITSTNTGTALNVSAGVIRVQGNTFTTNQMYFVSNSATLTIEQDNSGRLGSTVYFDVGDLTTSLADQSTLNIASANVVNVLNQFAVNIFKASNNLYNTVNANFDSANTYANSISIPAFRHANAAYIQSNIVFDTANAAFMKANMASILVSNTTPTGQTAGTLWWNNDYGRLFIYYNDGDTSQWVDAVPQDDSGTYALNTANAAYTQANAAFTAANTKLTNGSITLAGSLVSTANVSDSKGNLRDLPLNRQSTSYTLTNADAGKLISTSASIIIPSVVFTEGQNIVIWNNSASTISISNASGVTMHLAGQSNTQNKLLAQRGVATIICVAANTFVLSGSGLA